MKQAIPEELSQKERTPQEVSCAEEGLLEESSFSRLLFFVK
jgi:hypothetical protein